MTLGDPGYVHDIDPDPRDPRAGELLGPWDGEPVDVGIVGVPFDACVPGRKGASEGPAAIREALRYNASYDAVRDVDLRELAVADLGDLVVPDAPDPGDVHAALIEDLEEVRDRVGTLVLLGGDHSLTHPAATTWMGPPAGLVYVDAHLDVRAFPPHSSGNSFRRLLEDRTVPGDALVNLGAKSFLNSAHHAAWADEQGVAVHPPDRVDERGIDAVLDDAVRAATDGTDDLYFSLDVDGIDQSHAPGASAPSPHGLLPGDVFEVAHRLGRAGASAMDVCECAPPLDPAGNTARVAATAVLHFLAGIVERRRG